MYCLLFLGISVRVLEGAQDPGSRRTPNSQLLMATADCGNRRGDEETGILQPH